MPLVQTIRPSTYADYLALPEGQRAELIDGELMMSPQPKGRHIAVTSILGAQLGSSFGLSSTPSASGPGGWWIFFEPECHLELDRVVVVPDLAGWRRERMPVRPSDSHKFTVIPDWICEVLSPSTASRDQIVKMPRYLAAGVQWAWIVDPASQHLDIYRAGRGELEGQWEPVMSLEGAARAALPPFEAVELDLGPWWSER